MESFKYSPHHPEDPWNRDKKEKKENFPCFFSYFLSFFLGFFLSVFGIFIIAILTKQSPKVVKYSFWGALVGFLVPLSFFFINQ